MAARVPAAIAPSSLTGACPDRPRADRARAGDPGRAAQTAGRDGRLCPRDRSSRRCGCGSPAPPRCPTIGDVIGVHASLSTGAILSTQAVPARDLDEYGPVSGPNAIFIRLRPGVSPAAGAALAEPDRSTSSTATRGHRQLESVIGDQGSYIKLISAAAGAAAGRDRELQEHGRDARHPGRRPGRGRDRRARPDADRIGPAPAPRPGAAQDARLHPRPARGRRRLAVRRRSR